MADFIPLPDKPTNADLAGGIEQLHNCFEAYKKIAVDANVVLSSQVKSVSDTQIATTQSINDYRVVVASKFDEVNGKIDNIASNNLKVKDALGVETKRKPIGLWSQSEVMWKGALGIGSVFAVWKFAAFLLPFIIKLGIGIGTFVIALNSWVIK